MYSRSPYNSGGALGAGYAGGGYGGAAGAGYGGIAGGGYGGAYRQQDCVTACCGPVACGGAGCGDACGAGGGTTILSYTGHGGSYRQETTYKYVGAGAGEFDVLRIPGRGPNCCLLCIIPGVLTLLLLPLLFFLVSPTNTTTTTLPPLPMPTQAPDVPPPLPMPTAAPDVPPPTTTSSQYDCEEGKESSWSTGKKAWCCDKEGAGCPTPAPPAPEPPPTTPPTTATPPPPPTTTEPKIDCAAGEPESWDTPKKVQCCLMENKGCPTTPMSTTTPCPIDCYAGYNDLDPLQWVRGWSGEKKLYCCKTANRGCPSELPPPSGLPPSGLPPLPDSSVYDCDAGYHSCMHCLRESWSPKKIEYCCRTEHKGCEGEEPE